MTSMAGVWDKTGRSLDWLIRGHFVVQLLGALGLGKFVQWLLTKYAALPSSLATAVWLLASAGVLWLLLTIFKQKSIVQVSPTQTINPNAIEQTTKAVDEFYATNNGPMLQETEDYIQRLAVYHKNPAERERFLVRAISACAVSYLYDMAWSMIYRSQLEALNELNARGALDLGQIKPFYEAAAAAYPGTYGAYPFESWLAFLRGQLLITQDGQIVQITVRGKDFLKYLVQCGRLVKDRVF
jgi:hypothetical protein